RAHSGPLDVAVAGGLPAAAAHLTLTALVLLACWRATRPTRPPWLAGAATGVAAVALQELVLFPTVEVSPLAWAVAGLVVAHTTPPTAPPTGPRTAPPAGPRASRPT